VLISWKLVAKSDSIADLQRRVPAGKGLVRVRVSRSIGPWRLLWLRPHAPDAKVSTGDMIFQRVAKRYDYRAFASRMTRRTLAAIVSFNDPARNDRNRERQPDSAG
jgi:hypothetical protein